MNLCSFWKRITYRSEGPGPTAEEASELRYWEQRAGEVMPQWDTRSIPDAWPAEQPRAEFAHDALREVDPDWKPR